MYLCQVEQKHVWKPVHKDLGLGLAKINMFVPILGGDAEAKVPKSTLGKCAHFGHFYDS